MHMIGIQLTNLSCKRRALAHSGNYWIAINSFHLTCEIAQTPIYLSLKGLVERSLVYRSKEIKEVKK